MRQISFAFKTCQAVRIRIGLAVCQISTPFLLSREKSRKTEAVFLVGSRELRGEIEIPPGLVFFLQLFLLEKQKKKLDGSRKFLICVLSCCMYGWLFV